MAAWQARTTRVVVAVCALGALGGMTPRAGAVPSGAAGRIAPKTAPASGVAPSVPLPDIASWIGDSDQPGALLGWAMFTAGDVNGDGFSDVVVGAPNWDSALQPDVGKVFVYHGSASGLGAAPAWSLEGAQAGEQLGYAAGTAGDVNGDGFDDLIVSAVNHTEDQANEGIVQVFLGSASGLAAVPAWTAEGNQPFSAFGHSVATAGDVNSDGFDDVVIGASLWDGAIQVDEGRALVYLGGQTGLQPIPAWTYQSHQSDARLGASVAGAGDVNGDGFDDVVVGASQYTGDQFQEGRAFLFFGDGGSVSGFPNWTSDGDQLFAWYGVRVATAGDTNGDGYSDVLIGTWSSANDQAEEGRAYVYLGSASGPGAGPVWVGEGNEDFSRFGAWVGTAGDVNGDGFADIIVGAWMGGAGDEGGAFVYLGSSAGPLPTPAWTATGDQPDGQFGLVVGTAGDVNGDGFSDVIVGAPAQDEPEADEGRAFVYHGRAEMPATKEAWGIEGNQADLLLGEEAAFADVNGDGYDDVIVGIPLYDSALAVGAGRVELYLGGAAGVSSTRAWSIEGTTTQMQLGRAVAGMDLNGDSYADIAVSAIGFENGEIAEGQVRVYFGSATGPGLLPSWVVEGNLEDMRMGSALAAAGDVNGDGYGDLLVGSDGYGNGEAGEGQASLFLGSAGGPGPSPAWSVEGNQADGGLGSGVAGAGDINGDGYSDVIVGAWRFDNPENDEGKVWVYLGSPGGLSFVPAWTAEGDQTLAYYGFSVATAGDVNGDGYSDILVGAYLWSHSEFWEGAAFLYLGSAAGLAATPSWTFECDFESAWCGYAVAGAGDLNADGYSDVVVGAPYFYDDHTNEGRVFAFLGSASGLGATPSWSVDGNQEEAALGALARGAGDVNGDGFPEILVGAPTYGNSEFWEGRLSLFPGNGRYGPDRTPMAARFFGAGIPPLGLADHAFGARLQLRGRSPGGRGRVNMEWEIAPLGVPLDGSGTAQLQQFLLTGSPDANGSVWPLEAVVGLFDQTLYHWRMRTLTRSPLFPRSPWFTPVFNGVQEADFRTPPPCRDFDGDGWGSPGQGDCPMGPATDCHDASAGIHPGAPELCDGIDNDCNALADDVPPPGPVNTLRLDAPNPGEVHFDWTPLPGPHVYDIVRGDLGALRTSGGNYAAATGGCIIDGFPYGGYISWNSGPPPVGSGDWFMIRASCGGVNGTYEGFSAGQAGLRDLEVAASGLDCP